MRNKFISIVMAVSMFFATAMFITPKQANALGSTTVYMYHRECIGTVWVGNTSYLAWDVGFARDTNRKFETWTTTNYTIDNLFGNNKRIQNMSYYANMSLSSSTLNNGNNFNYSYCNK